MIIFVAKSIQETYFILEHPIQIDFNRMANLLD